MKKLAFVLLAALIVGGGCCLFAIGKSTGYGQGFEKGRAEGFNAGSVVTAQTANQEDSVKKSDYMDLIDKYNDLVRDYNAAQKTSLSCFSSTYGYNTQYTTTNCY